MRLAEAGPHPGRCWNPWQTASMRTVDTARTGLLRVRASRLRRPKVPRARGCLAHLRCVTQAYPMGSFGHTRGRHYAAGEGCRFLAAFGVYELRPSCGSPDALNAPSFPSRMASAIRVISWQPASSAFERPLSSPPGAPNGPSRPTRTAFSSRQGQLTLGHQRSGAGLAAYLHRDQLSGSLVRFGSSARP